MDKSCFLILEMHVTVCSGGSVKTCMHCDARGTVVGCAVVVGDAVVVGGEVVVGGLVVPGRAVTSVGTPEGSPPVSHHEYVVPLTVPLPIPAISPP